ncbi:hypothetical protein TcasGA2_TC008114 [Tribolium castaneum]|uniref:Uncharacterized protein n=1 Tax=Tribolium castaneum TaxID=7070 RepID=D1ZZW3_TRICA|nr:hypothetical protein TcasGA2_TC008114 [Tribolium castaneum]
MRTGHDYLLDRPISEPLFQSFDVMGRPPNSITSNRNKRAIYFRLVYGIGAQIQNLKVVNVNCNVIVFHLCIRACTFNTVDQREQKVLTTQRRVHNYRAQFAPKLEIDGVHVREPPGVFNNGGGATAAPPEPDDPLLLIYRDVSNRLNNQTDHYVRESIMLYQAAGGPWTT